MIDAQQPRHDAPIRGCEEACAACLQAIDSLPDGLYGAPVRGHSSIGAHLRHCFDHFIAFFEGLESNGPIDYEARRRDPELETNPAAARRLIDSFLQRLAALDPNELDSPVTVLDTPALNAPPAELGSTVRRELVFLSSHSIHHLALVKLLAEMADCSLPKGLGVANSTAAHWAAQGGAPAPRQ